MDIEARQAILIIGSELLVLNEEPAQPERPDGRN
jgi:hypothetical protein